MPVRNCVDVGAVLRVLGRATHQLFEFVDGDGERKAACEETSRHLPVLEVNLHAAAATRQHNTHVDTQLRPGHIVTEKRETRNEKREIGRSGHTATEKRETAA